MAYKVILDIVAKENFDDIVRYVAVTLENVFAARKIRKEILATLKRIAQHPKSFPLLEDAKLRGLGLRKAHLNHYKYKIFFIVREDEVWVEAILHDSQDYKNILI